MVHLVVWNLDDHDSSGTVAQECDTLEDARKLKTELNKDPKHNQDIKIWHAILVE